MMTYYRYGNKNIKTKKNWKKIFLEMMNFDIRMVEGFDFLLVKIFFVFLAGRSVLQKTFQLQIVSVSAFILG